MSARVNITDNTVKIRTDYSRNINLAIRYMVDDIERVAYPVTPKDKGNLRRDILKTVLGHKGTIVWGKNYAVYQEKKRFKNYTTPGTGPHFAEKSVEKVVSKSEDYFKRANLI